jgi:hypothetical protein
MSFSYDQNGAKGDGSLLVTLKQKLPALIVRCGQVFMAVNMNITVIPTYQL